MSRNIYRDRLVVRTKLLPPRPPRHTLSRPRLTKRLLEAFSYRVTVVRAGTGYGKSTALAALVVSNRSLAWYHLDAEDADPLVFLLHLVHALAAAVPGFSDAPLAALEAWDRETGEEVWLPVVDIVLGELVAAAGEKPLLLVLDDAHHLNKRTAALRILDHLAGRAPANLHLILSRGDVRFAADDGGKWSVASVTLA